MATSRQTRWILTGTLGIALLAGSAVMAQESDKRPAPPAESKPAEAQEQKQQAPGTIEYRAQNRVFKAHGEFTSWRFKTVHMPEGKFEGGHVEIEIDVASITANNDRLNNHLKAHDMLNVEKFPKATVKVHSATPLAPNVFSAKADVTILGVTRTVPMEFRVEGAEEKTVTGTAVLNRDEFGIYTPYDPSDDRSPEQSVQISFTARLPKTT